MWSTSSDAVRVGLPHAKHRLNRRSPFKLSVMLALGSAIALSACTSTSPVPPRDLASIFTPTAADQAANTDTNAKLEQAVEPGLAPKPESTASAAPKTDDDTSNVVAALSPAKEPAPSVAAAKTVATPAQTAVKKPAAVAAAQTKQLEQAEKKDGSLLGLFRAFNKSNQQNRTSPQANNTEVATRSSSRTTSSARPTRTSNDDNLPGVKPNTLFGTTKATETKRPDAKIEVASAASRAVRGNHGLLLQRSNVQVNCFPPRLLALLRQVERRFGRKVIVTSGFRSRSYNRRIRGARNSTHTRCLAADIQVKGISKWQMAKYLRSLPGRGGVGTYCHTKSVHIDIGKKRSWNYCTRRRGKKQRS